MLINDTAVAEQAELILETIIFFIIPIILLLADLIPFNQRHLLLGTITMACLTIYHSRSQQPEIQLTRSSAVWLIPLLLIITLIISLNSFDITYDGRLLAYAIIVSAPQEFLFREYLQRRLTQAYNPMKSIVVTSMVFSLTHVIYADLITTLLITGGFSLIVGVSYHYDRNIVLATGIHAVANYLAINTCLIAIPGTC